MAWLYKRGGVWWIGWRVNGRQFRKSTGQSDEKHAKSKLNEYLVLSQAVKDQRLAESWIETLTGRSFSGVTFKSAVDEWLKECEGATAPNTLLRYRAVADELSAYLGASAEKPLLRDVTTDELRAFLVHKRSKCSAATTNLNRKILATFFLRAIRNGLRKDNPMTPIRSFKGSQDELSGRRPLTLEEIKLLYSKAPTDFWRYMVMAGYTTGLRLGDLATMRWGAVDLVENVFRLTARKTSRPMQIPIAAPLREFLTELRRRAGSPKSTEFLWREQAEAYVKHGAKVISNEFYSDVLVPAGLAKHRTHRKTKSGRGAAREIGVSFHSLRHSFVSTLKLTGASQSVAKELAGHSSDAVSDIYTHTPVEALKAAIQNLPSIASNA